MRRDGLSLVLGYGDSTDDTDAMLFEATSGGIGARLIDVTHGGEVYGSIVDERRFRQLAYIGNKIFANIPDDVDAVVWCESDLIWEPKTMMALIDRLQDYPAVAPMVMHAGNPGLYPGGGPFFYDSYCHRRNGQRFSNTPPYHPELGADMLQMDSAGSVLAMNAGLVKHIKIGSDVLIGACRQIYELGGSVWLDPALIFFHP